MSEQFDELNKLHTPRTRKGGGPLSSDERNRRQEQLLKAFRESGNIKHSCKVARINRTTFYNWRDQDEEFRAQLVEAERDADDTLEFAAYERAVKGVPSHVISQGKMVYGPNKKPLIERKYSDGLLTTLLKARMPEKYKDRIAQEHSGPNGTPIQLRNEDLKQFTDEELDMLQTLAEQAIERRGHGSTS